MAEVIDFQEYKERKNLHKTDFEPTRHESYCPRCWAPTTIKKTAGGSDSHTFDPTEAYEKLHTLLTRVVTYFCAQDDVSDEALIEAFGDGMAQFLKDMR
jgi:hypothetical protein